MQHLLVSAPHKSSGKTIISIGLCAALRARGLAVQPFKKGPDFIDPLWLGAAAGRDCHNLDFHTMDGDEVTATFVRHASRADVSIIEGTKGLFDGVSLDGSVNQMTKLLSKSCLSHVMVQSLVGLQR